MNGSMGITMGVKAGAANPLADFGTMFWVNYGLTIICYLIGSVILTSLVYALIKTYNEREERLEGVTLSSLKSLLFKNVGRLLKLTLFGILIMIILCVVMGLLAALDSHSSDAGGLCDSSVFVFADLFV